MIGFNSRCVWWNWTHRIISSNFTILLSTICISPNINNSGCKLIPVLVTLLRFCNPSTLIYNNRVLSKAWLSHTIFFHRLVLVLFSGKSDLRERRWIFLLLCLSEAIFSAHLRFCYTHLRIFKQCVRTFILILVKS